jgi:hypothetical protein
MKTGIFIQIDGEWLVESEGFKYPIYDKDLVELGNCAILPGDSVEFEIIDEFTHPQLFEHVGWGEGITCAKINFTDEGTDN